MPAACRRRRTRPRNEARHVPAAVARHPPGPPDVGPPRQPRGATAPTASPCLPPHGASPTSTAPHRDRHPSTDARPRHPAAAYLRELHHRGQRRARFAAAPARSGARGGPGGRPLLLCLGRGRQRPQPPAAGTGLRHLLRQRALPDAAKPARRDRLRPARLAVRRRRHRRDERQPADRPVQPVQRGARPPVQRLRRRGAGRAARARRARGPAHAPGLGPGVPSRAAVRRRQGGGLQARARATAASPSPTTCPPTCSRTTGATCRA